MRIVVQTPEKQSSKHAAGSAPRSRYLGSCGLRIAWIGAVAFRDGFEKGGAPVDSDTVLWGKCPLKM